MKICRRFLISGRVQGVAFRAWTREQARLLELGGWAANLADGRVEVVACGDPDALELLRRKLRAGPPAARVTAVDEAAADPIAEVPGIANFMIR
ncbi:MAG: acylphosphatase [Betaproteobacteria bacterium]